MAVATTWRAGAVAVLSAHGLLPPAVADSGTDTYSPPGVFVTVDDHRLHIHCLGEGSPTVIFDSGLGGSSLDWSRVHENVGKTTRACVYDRAGYGWSERAPGPRHSINIVSDLERLLHAGNIAGPYVMVGHSFGGLNVRLFASRHPAQIAGLVLVDSSHEAQFERFEQAGIRGLVPNRRQFFIGNTAAIPDGLPEHLRPLAHAFAMSRNAAGTLYSELAHLQLSARQVGAAHNLPDVPMVVISRTTTGLSSTSGSGNSELNRLWLELQRDLARRTRHGRLVIARTRDHYIQLSEPDLVVTSIRNVVDAANRAGT